MSFGRRSAESRREAGPQPGEVTRISAQLRTADRLNVDLDGEFAFGLSTNVALEYRLTVGTVIDDHLAAELWIAEEAAQAKATALNLLARRPRAEKELATGLRQRGYGAAAIQTAVERMRELGYLDDADFARRWVASRAGVSPRGGRLMELELRQKGVAQDVAREAVDEADLDDLSAARAVAETRLRRLADLDEPTRRRRLSAFLARRGFSPEVIRTIDRDLRHGGEDDEMNADGP
jgi:regulatory protein